MGNGVDFKIQENIYLWLHEWHVKLCSPLSIATCQCRIFEFGTRLLLLWGNRLMFQTFILVTLILLL